MSLHTFARFFKPLGTILQASDEIGVRHDHAAPWGAMPARPRGELRLQVARPVVG